MTTRPRQLGPVRARSAFSLVELVMVVTIIGIVSAIAVPRVSAAAQSASANSLRLSIANVRKAIDSYYAEHSTYPGRNPSTKAADGTRFVNQLLLYTDYDGNTKTTYGYPFIYGPYLRAPFPANPINTLTTVHVKATPAAVDPAAGSVGWIAVLSHGYFMIAATTIELENIGVEVKFRSDMRAETQ